MPSVSVIVPVFNPGADIDDCIRSLLGQTMPPEQLELIFVDDGSTDATPARLDELAERHAHVRVAHIPNSGWPGKPRNIGLDLATGDYVLFVDNDDWIEPDAVERLNRTAVEDRADIVIGKVVGHGKGVPRAIFEHNRHGGGFDSDVLLSLLTPHKLFGREFVDRHGLRFPEGRRRLEDHMFVVGAYFAATRISVLSDRPVYHWMRREEQDNASYQRFDAGAYYADVREVLDLVETKTEPGPWRDRLLTHWYRGKMLGRVGGVGWLRRDAAWRPELFEEVRKLALERFGEDVHDRLPFHLRIRSRLMRAGDYEALERLARYERRLQAVVKVRRIERAGTHVVLRLESRLAGEKARVRFERDGKRILWMPPTRLADAVPREARDATRAVRHSEVKVFLRNVVDDTEYAMPARTRVRLEPGNPPGRVRPRLHTAVPIAPTAAAAGAPLPAGTWEVRAEVMVAGFSRTVTVEHRGEPLLLTTYPPGRIVVGTKVPPPPGLASRAYRRLPGPAMTALRRTKARVVAGARG